MSYTTKKTLARDLYLEGITLSMISRVLNVSLSTLSKWKKEGKWQTLRDEVIMARETSEEAVRELIAYQLDALKRKKNEMIESGEFKPIDKGDLDGLYKLFATIRRKGLEWKDYVKVIKEFLAYTERHDKELSKQMADIAEAFLQDKRIV